MNIHHWIGVGVLSLSLAGGGASAADLQRWRPAPQEMPPMRAMPMPPAVPAPPAPPAMRIGMDDPRFRPVPMGSLRMPPQPPQPPMPYAGRPFVSVEGQSMPPPPAFVRQYEWRPAGQVADNNRPEQARDVYAAPEPYPMQPRMMAPPSPYVPYAPSPYMPYTPYANLMPYAAMPPGLMPPPMPYPPFPPAMPPGAYPGDPYTGLPEPGFAPFGSPYSMWGVPPYPAPPPPAYPYQPLPAAPWGAAWPDQAYSAWGGARTGYPDATPRSRMQGGLGTGFPIAGLY